MTKISALLICLLFLPATLRAQSHNIVIATGEWAPFSSETMEDAGLVNGLLNRSAQQAGIDIEFSFMPWKRALEATRSGHYGATSTWYYSEARVADFIHVGPILTDNMVFFHRKDHPVPNWTELVDLAEFRIGVVPGYTYTPELWQLAKEGVITIVEAPSDEANLRKLLAGRIDIFPLSDVVGWHTIDQIFTSEERAQLTVSDRPLSAVNGYLLISRKLDDAQILADRLQAAVEIIAPDLKVVAGPGTSP